VVGLPADWAMPSRLLIPRRGTSKPERRGWRLVAQRRGTSQTKAPPEAGLSGKHPSE
jgi:hypothetical protein